MAALALLMSSGCDKMGTSCFDRKCTKIERKFRDDLKGNDIIYFALNKSDLDDVSKAVVVKQVEWLNTNAELSIMIYGYCDERGSEKYNHALGLMRALAVKKEMMRQGISEARIKIGSKGKKSQLVDGDGEEIWAQNRAALTNVYIDQKMSDIGPQPQDENRTKNKKKKSHA